MSDDDLIFKFKISIGLFGVAIKITKGERDWVVCFFSVVVALVILIGIVVLTNRN